MTDLERIFREHDGNIIHKWDHYFEIYERHFSKYRNKPITIAEIGVSKGGSLEMWRKYFGQDCTIIGIDINPTCKKFENEYTKIFIGSQDDPKFLAHVREVIPKVDILIDDGGHMMHQLRISFEQLYNWVDDNGIYLAEDLHTCYWPAFEGGYKRKTSFIEYCKNLIDKLNAWHSTDIRLEADYFTISTHSIHFYDSIVTIEKKRRRRPTHSHSGNVDFTIIDEPPQIKGLWRKLKNKLYILTH
jgi:23S rRNA U2552 (ribose-2'-O)-methylase RlmE/FtsJ